MRDGVKTYADIYRPSKEGRYPVIVSRTPYSTELHATPVYQYPHAYEAPALFARRGYVFVFQDIRGRHESDGTWEPFRNDIADGYDTIEWAARQPWSNGKVGMWGVSYQGTVQWLAAMSRPPHLVTIVPSVASTSIYRNWITQDGAWRLGFNFEWGPIRQETRVVQNSGLHHVAGGPPELSIATMLWHLPLRDMQRLAGRNAQFYRDWMAHPDYDDYWKAIDAEETFGELDIPVLNFGGWFDLFRQGTLNGYTLLRAKGKGAARDKTNLVIGAWGHWPSRKVGNLDFGETSMVDQNALALRWLDYWLKGLDNGVDREPPVKIFVMGRNEWRAEADYPLKRTRYQPLYLHSAGHANGRGDGRLSWEKPSGPQPADQFTYDPADPLRSGGPGGEGSAAESRQDVLVYTSDPLPRELEVTGPVRMKLFAASSAVDTDFVARLADVYPDGRSICLAQGILRARYRNSVSRPEWLEPGKVYPLDLDLIGASNVFLPGHRIRISITSSHFPSFDRHPNTGAPFGEKAEAQVAWQTVHHDGSFASHILLPVIPGHERSGSTRGVSGQQNARPLGQKR